MSEHAEFDPVKAAMQIAQWRTAPPTAHLVPDPGIHIYPTEPMLTYLHRLVRSGLYGRTVDEAATRLLERALLEMVRDATIIQAIDDGET